MDDLIAFWRARLDEREKIAREAMRTDGQHWEVEGIWEDDDVNVVDKDGAVMADKRTKISKVTSLVERGTGEHIAANDPASVLADITADRAILTMLEEQSGRYLPEGVHDGRDPAERECDAAVKATLEDVARIRVAKYASHPDYNASEWAP